jgi:hypothetical protein
MKESTDLSLVYMKQADVMKSTGHCNIIVNKWFAVHPDTGDLMFWQPIKKRQGKLLGAAPQCNSSKFTAEIIYKKIYPWASIAFFERVAFPILAEDYLQ